MAKTEFKKPPFPEWYCFIKQINENSPLGAKLRTKYEIISLGYTTDLPAFLNNL